jgi:hypothetical protein
MGEMHPPHTSVNVRYIEKLAKKDWLRNLQTAYFEHRVALRHARIKSHYVRYFGVTSRNVHFVEHLARLLLPAEVVAQGEGYILKRLDTSMREIDKETVRVQGLLQAEGVTALPEYVQAPLELDARCTSPKMTRYLELMLKADRLFTMLEALRLAGAVSTAAYDYRSAVIVARLVDVARTALKVTIGLRKRAHAAAANDSARAPLRAPAKPGPLPEAAAPAVTAAEAGPVDGANAPCSAVPSPVPTEAGVATVDGRRGGGIEPGTPPR